MAAFTEAALLREVARVQHDKTLQAVRDVIDSIPTTKPSSSGRSWETTPRTITEFRGDLVAALIKMREEA